MNEVGTDEITSKVHERFDDQPYSGFDDLAPILDLEKHKSYINLLNP